LHGYEDIEHYHSWATYLNLFVCSGRPKIRIHILPVRSAEKIRSDHPHFTRYKTRRSTFYRKPCKSISTAKYWLFI